jgi:hypothetical protein
VGPYWTVPQTLYNHFRPCPRRTPHCSPMTLNSSQFLANSSSFTNARPSSAPHLLLNQFRTDSKPLFADSSFYHYSHAPFGFVDASLGGPFRLGGGSLGANTNWRKMSIFLDVEDVIRQLEFRKSGSLLFTTAGSDVDATVAQGWCILSIGPPIRDRCFTNCQ